MKIRTSYRLAILSSIAVTGLCVAPLPAAAGELCDLIKCTNNCYVTITPKHLVSEEGCEEDSVYVIKHQSVLDPPAPAGLQCDTVTDGYLCEAWPQGDNVSYTWSGSEALDLPPSSDAENPFITVNCNGAAGTLAVTVHGPSGTPVTETVQLPACSAD